MRYFAVVLFAGLCTATAQAKVGKTVDVPNSAFEDVTDGKPSGWHVRGSWQAGRQGINGSGGLVWRRDTLSERQEISEVGIRLAAGGKYRIKYFVTTHGFEVPRGEGFMQGIEFFGKDGKRLGGSYQPMPLYTKDANRWIVYEREFTVPTEAEKSMLMLWVTKNCRGTVVVDDIAISEIVLDPIVCVTSGAYQDRATGGKVGFHAWLQVPAGKRPADLKATFLYADRIGRGIRVPAETLTEDEASVTLDVGDFAMGFQNVRCELSLKSGGKLCEECVGFTRVGELPKRHVWIDEHHRFIVDGKPFFPHGMYAGWPNETEVRKYRAAGFNTMLPYAMHGLDRAAMDLLYRNGIMTIQDLHEVKPGGKWAKGLRGLRTDEEFCRAFKSLIDDVKDHPGLLAWYLDDENRLSEVENSRVLCERLRGLDETHPIFSVFDRVDSLRAFQKAYDVAGGDKYPFPGPIDRVASFDDGVRHITFADRCYVAVTQDFWLDWLQMNEEEMRGWRRFPTEEELRCQKWTHLAYGAKGLLGYWFVDCVSQKRTENERDGLWKSICRTAAEVNRFIPVFLSVEKASSVTGGSVTLPTRTWRHGGRLYVLAVNCSDKPAKATLTLSEGGWADGRRELGTAAVATGPRTLQVALAPKAVSFTSFGAR